MLQAYVSKCFICFRCMLQQVPHVSSVFISRYGRQVQAEAVPACMPSSMACMHATTGACSRSMWARVAAACAAGKAACVGA
jgi:hypothetical protein